MLRLAFDFIITWRETRTRPNAYKENGRIWFSLRWRWIFTCVKSCCHQCETTVSHWWSNSIYRKFTHWHPIKLNESTAYPVRFNLISTLLLQITGECSTPSLTYRFGGIADFFTQQIAGNEWNEVAEEFYVLRKTKLSFYQFDHEVWTGSRFWNLVMLLLKI